MICGKFIHNEPFSFRDHAQKMSLAAACLAMSITSLSNLAFPKLIGKLIDQMNATKCQPNKRFVMMTLAVLTMGALGSWVRTYFFNLASFSVSRRLRTKLYRSSCLRGFLRRKT
jgi:ABC-type multidrug transport system fused ATPase/permease subunit